MTENSGDSRSLWKHRKGDRYVAVFGDWWGNPTDGYRHEWSTLTDICDTRAQAQSWGFRAQGSDDFNIAVVRGRKVVATLWMTEVVDDDPAELAPLQAHLFVSDAQVDRRPS